MNFEPINVLYILLIYHKYLGILNNNNIFMIFKKNYKNYIYNQKSY